MKHYLIIALLLALASCGQILEIKKNKNMKTIKFIPEKFENIDFESMEREMCPCSPNYPERLSEMNALKINVPKKIFFHRLDEKLDPVFPICIAYSKSVLRELKYHDFSERTIHIKPENGDFEHSGNYFDKSTVNKTPIDMNSLLTAEGLQQRQQRIEEAQKLSDDELNKGTYSGGYLNVNALDFVSIPIKSGKYEIWVTYYGLESNHTIVEIIIEGEVKAHDNQPIKE